MTDYGTVYALAARALGGGIRLTQKSVSHLCWDCSLGCERPQHVELFGRPKQLRYPDDPGLPPGWWAEFKKHRLVAADGHSRTYTFDGKRDETPLWVELDVPCRKCQKCLARRRREWQQRARLEILRAARTWFCTLTIDPHHQHMIECAARHADDKNGDVFESRSAGQQFMRRVSVNAPEVTRFIKRVRKNSSAKIRYLIVAEAHKTGLPHYHMLVHEVDPATPVRKRVLKDAWHMGLTDFKLCDEGAASYVTKYLTKDLATRVRGSLHYGHTGSPIGVSREYMTQIPSHSAARSDCQEREFA